MSSGPARSLEGKLVPAKGLWRILLDLCAMIEMLSVLSGVGAARDR